MHRNLASATSTTGSAACLQSAGCAFRFNGRRFGLRRDDLWPWLDKLAASTRLAGDWLGVLLHLWTPTQQGSSAKWRSAPAEERSLDGGLEPLRRGPGVSTRKSILPACLGALRFLCFPRDRRHQPSRREAHRLRQQPILE